MAGSGERPRASLSERFRDPGGFEAIEAGERFRTHIGSGCTADKTCCIGKRKISLSSIFAGQYVGVTEIADDIWLVSFMDYDLGFFDKEVNWVEPVGENPFAPKVLPMCRE